MGNKKKKRKGRRNQNGKRFGDLSALSKVALIELLVVLLMLVFVTAFFLMRNGEKKDIIGAISEEQPELPETETESENEQKTEQEVVCEPPAYDFTVEEVVVEIEGLQREYTLAWVSDLHMITDKEAGDVDVAQLYDVKKRYDDLPVTQEGIHAEELWPEIVKFLNYQEFDGIIFGGDMIDYCSTSNIEALKEGYDSLRAPVLYVRADHDYGSWYGSYSLNDVKAHSLQASIDGDDIEKKYLEFDDFIVIGVDNSNKNMPSGQMWMLEELYNKRKPVIAVTHVPYESEVDDSLEKLSFQVRNKVYYWGGGDYIPNEYTEEYLHMIYREETCVEQVLAGHLHASWDGMMTEQVPEHIFGPAFDGHIGVIHVVPEKT